MKNTFKLLFIFMGGLMAIIVITIAGFILIEKNKTFYIYDVRFVMPVEDEEGYVYTYVPTSDEDIPVIQYESIKNSTVYMYSDSENLFPIAVYASTSNETTDVKITSSDTSVARIVLINGLCYVKYLKEGIVTIKCEVGGVSDSFILKILDMVPSNFQVFDLEYYGEEYVNLFPNSLVGYADGLEYRYGYKLVDVTGSEEISKINGDLIRIDKANLDTTIFDEEGVYIDSASHELVITCKVPESAQTENINTSIILQSFTYGKDGEEIIQDNYIVNVYVVLEIPEFLQIEVSKSPDFEESYVYTNTHKDENFSYTDEEILANPSLLEDYLSAEKAEKYLAEREENSTYNVYFTEKVSKLYIRFRMVYTNGKVEYLTNGENATFKFNGLDSDNYCKLAPMDNYYILKLSADDSNDNYYYTETLGEYNTYAVTVSLNDYIFDPFTFNFEYIEQNTEEDTIAKLYKKDDETGIYTYKYWDERARFTNEICDENGNIVGFGA